MARQIVDMHQHISTADQADNLAETYGRLGVIKAVLLGMPPHRLPDNNSVVLASARRHPGLYVPYVGFDLDQMSPADVVRSHESGYVGIKFIGPRRPYNDPAYFSVYEKAAEVGMPVLFHLGIVANTGPWRDCDSGLMRPIHLDHIARTIPGLRIVGAHLGNPWSDEAAMACRWNPNLFFDLSGSLLKYRKPDYLGGLLWWKASGPYKSPDGTSAWQKIVFGSDVAPDEVADVIHDYEVLMDALNLDADLRQQIWGGTAMKVLGL